MYYSEDIIEEVRIRNDIVDVIGGYVTLKRREIPIWRAAHFTMRKHPPSM